MTITSEPTMEPRIDRCPQVLAVESPAPHHAWKACHDADPQALPSQSPEWRDAMEATGQWRDASRHYRFADGRELVLPLVRPRGVRRSWSRLSVPDAWGFGGPVGGDIDAPTIASVLADLDRLRTGWVRIRPNPLQAGLWDDAVDMPGVEPLRLAKRAHVLELDPEPDRLFAERFTSSARRNVRAATRAGIEIEVDTEGNLAPIFHDLLMRSVDRWAGAAHEPLALARLRARRRDPVEKFLAWSEAMHGGCRILVARRDGQPIAAMIVLQGVNAHMTRNAMDRELVGSDRPNELLYWHAIRDACLAGCRWFHMGESGGSASLARYKEKYGAVGFDYPELRLEHLPVTRVDAAARAGVRRILGVRSS